MTQDRARGLVVWSIAMLAASLVLAWTLYQVRAVLLVVYVALLLAIGMSPAIRWLERVRISKSGRQRMPRWAAILVLYIGVIGFIVTVFAVIIPPFAEQVQALWASLPEYVDRLQRTLVSYRLITHRWTWSELVKNVPMPVVALGGVLGFLQNVLSAVGATVTVIVLPYYILLEASDLQKGFIRFFPAERRPQVSRITRNLATKVGAWLGGQVLLSVVIGLTTGIALKLLGVPYYYVFALLSGIGEAIPVVGPILSAIPAVLVALTVSPQTAIFTAIFFGAQQFVENNFLVPRVMQRQVGLNAVTVVVALLIGTELLGFVGAVLAVPTAAIVQVLVREYLAENES